MMISEISMMMVLIGLALRRQVVMASGQQKCLIMRPQACSAAHPNDEPGNIGRGIVLAISNTLADKGAM